MLKVQTVAVKDQVMSKKTRRKLLNQMLNYSQSIKCEAKKRQRVSQINNKSLLTLLRISYQRRMISCKTVLGRESLNSLNVDKAMLKAFSRTKARLYRTKLNYSNHLIFQEVSSKPPKFIPTFFQFHLVQTTPEKLQTRKMRSHYLKRTT